MIERDRQHLVTCDRWSFHFDRKELRRDGLAVPLGLRSLELFELLVRSSGQIVSKGDMFDRVWPGAFVEENTLQVHISAIRRVLGPDRGLLKMMSGRGYVLLGDWKAVDGDLGASTRVVRGLNTPLSSNLPLTKPRLIGRATATLTLQDLVSAYRVVTLSGPGGIGKTALCIAVAHDLVPKYPGVVRLIDLSTLSDPRLATTLTASVLNLKILDSVEKEAVAEAIGSRELLLIFDNCEHVREAAAALVGTIVERCPNVHVMATSREPLQVDGEFAYRVPSLDLPDDDGVSLEKMLSHSAIELFVTRVRSLQPSLQLLQRDVQAASAVCRKLDGIPLAIEFAAARASTLGVPEVLASLDDLFGSLTTGRRPALPRHQTLRATLDWSYDLLPLNDQRLLRSLAVFASGFTLDAVAAVVRDFADVKEAKSGIETLASKSLLSPDQFGSAARWRLLQTTRTYALEKLVQKGELQQASRRHAEYFHDLVSRKFTEQSAGHELSLIGKESSNVRAALDWAFSVAGDPVLGAGLAAEYAPVWLHLSSMGECGEQMQRALDSLRDDSSATRRLRMRLLIAYGLVLAYTAAMETKTETILEKALSTAEEIDDVESQLIALWSLWNLKLKNGDHRRGLRLAYRFKAVAMQSIEPTDVLVGARLIGTSLHFKGDQQGAQPHLRSIMKRYQSPSNHKMMAWYLHDLQMAAQTMLARVEVMRGFPEKAAASAVESLRIAENVGSNLSICYALRYAVCSVALITEDLADAGRSVEWMIALATKCNFIPFVKLGRYVEGMLAIKRGEFAGGTQILRAALEDNMNDGWTLCYPEALSVLAEGFIRNGKTSEASFTIQRAMEWSDRSGERWCDPELLRIKASLHVCNSMESDVALSEKLLFRAMAVARKQHALFWELKAALDLARLRLTQGRQEDAKQLLRPVYDRFSEGFSMPHLRLAREILETD